MASSTSSSSASASSQIISVARQLSSLWKPRQTAKLLNQPPPAAFTGRAKEAVQESTRLLKLLAKALQLNISATASQQVLHGLFQQLKAVELLATLTAWLQQLPNFAAGPLENNCRAMYMWMGCMESFMHLLLILTSCQPAGVAAYAGQLAQALDSAGV
jgi:hypothetical protein